MYQVRAVGSGRRSAAAAAFVAALSLTAVLLESAPAAAATTVYRSVDSEGRVVFSDTPPGPGESAETVEIREPTSFEAPATPPPADASATWDWDMTASGEEEGGTFTYTAATVLSPANDESVRENSGTVTIVAGVDPELRPGHQIQVLMDGQIVATTGGNQVTLTEVDRGTHTLLVRVVDESGAILIEGVPSTFHMQRYAPLLAPNRPRPTPHGN
jgi:hypothetical protein